MRLHTPLSVCQWWGHGLSHIFYVSLDLDFFGFFDLCCFLDTSLRSNLSCGGYRCKVLARWNIVVIHLGVLHDHRKRRGLITFAEYGGDASLGVNGVNVAIQCGADTLSLSIAVNNRALFAICHSLLLMGPNFCSDS